MANTVLKRLSHWLSAHTSRPSPSANPASDRWPIAIIGMAGVFPGAADRQQFWRNLEAGERFIREIPLERFSWRDYYQDLCEGGAETASIWGGFLDDIACFDAERFGINPRRAERMDPQQRLFLQTAWRTIEDAGYRPAQLAGPELGVFVGACFHNYTERLRWAQTTPDVELIYPDLIANRVSHWLDARGPSESIHTACCSSLTALHRAGRAIADGECDWALAGGVSVLLSPYSFRAFANAGVASPSGGGRVFDQQSDGWVRGEGVGAVLLKPLAKALADGDVIHAVITGSAVGHGGHTGSLLGLRRTSQIAAMVRAHRQADADPAQVGYLEIQGSGKAKADLEEVLAMSEAFEQLGGAPTSGCPVSCLKPAIGHLEAAAGVAAVIKVTQALQHRRIPGITGLEQPLAALAELPFQFSSQPQPWEVPRDEYSQPLPRVAAINSFAYGGTNVHLVLREAPPLPDRAPLPERERLLIFSAADPSRLRQTVAALHDFLGEEPVPPLADIAHTLQVGREEYRYRLAVLAKSHDEARLRLSQWLAGKAGMPGIRQGETTKGGLWEFGREPEDRDYLAALWQTGKLDRIAALWLQGAPLPWADLNRPENCRRVSLPPTPWATTRFWIDSSPGPALHVEDSDSSLAETELPIPSQGEARSERRSVFAERLLDVVRSALSLPDDPALIECSLPDLGVDSLHAHELRGILSRTLAVDAPLPLLLTAPSLGALAQQLETVAATHPPAPTPLPWIADHAHRFAPFPLTDIQFSYLLGRDDHHALGGQGCHLYWEFERDQWDIDRLEQVWNQLVARHDMLRAVFSSESRQRVLPEVPPYQLEIQDGRALPEAEASAQLAAWRTQYAHQCFAVDQWPLFRVGVAQLPGRMRLLLSIDLLLADGMSLFLLLTEWARGYDGALDCEEPPLFRDYVQSLIAHQKSEHWRRSLAYWRDRLDALPPAPELPLQTDPALLRQPHYRRLEYRLPLPLWDRLRDQARQWGLTPVAVLTTAFAEALARWASHPRFTLNLTVAQRLPVHPRITETVGDFTSNLLLAVDLSDREPFAVHATRLGQQLLQDLEHAEVSGARVLGELTRHRRKSVLMPVVFTSLLGYEAAGQTLNVEALGRFVGGLTQTPQVWLDAQAMIVHDGLYLSWDAVEALFDAPLLEALFAAFTERLAALAEQPALWEQAGSGLPAAQRARRQAANATDAAIPSTLLHAAFWERARREPGRLAVIAPDRQLSYGELAARAAELAVELQRHGVRRNELIAVVMEKGWEQAVAVLAITQAGAAYLPIEASQPARRIHELLDLGEVRLALSQCRLKERLNWPARLTVRWMDETPPVVADLPMDHGPAAPDDLAYVIFTSGSTGVPKGVMISHQAAANTVQDINRRFAVSAEDRVLALSALSFDLSVYDLFGPLSVGGALVLPEPALLRDPQALAQLIAQQRVTLWNSVPSYLQLLADALTESTQPLLAGLRLALLSGDWIPLTLPARIKALAPHLQLISLGGATEAAIWSIFHPIDEVDPAWRSIPYGKPLANQRFYVLNEQMEDCPDDIAGELYIGGAGVAQGYWRDDARTQTSFPQHPDTGERLYRTGDLGRYRADGSIEFLGRRDTQVKLSGYRVELGEVEAMARQCPEVGEVAAVTFSDAHGQRRLALGYLHSADSPVAETTLQDFLRERLPEYMIPARYLPLECWPLTANGKLDRQALAEKAQQGQNRHSDAHSPPLPLAPPAEAKLQTEESTPPPDLLTQVIANAEVLKDRSARDAFIQSRPGLRRDLPAATIIALPDALTPEQQQAYRRRRSARRFAPGPLPAERLYALLACLRGLEQGNLVKYRYPSAGGSYCVQSYLHLKTGGCQDLTAGTYYYHPLQNALLRISDDAPDLTDLHVPGNRPIFAAAGFSLFLIADLRAIRPLYGEASLDLTRLEAGHIAQLLMEEAAAANIDLCPIGYLNFTPARPHFALNDPDQILLYSLLGGGRLTEALTEENTEQPLHRSSLLEIEATTPSSLETTVAAIWARVLQVPAVEADAQFFEIGGNSFAVLDVQREITQELDVECPVAQLFRYPTVRTLAAYLATLQPASKTPIPSPAQSEPVVESAQPTEVPASSRRDRRRAIRQQINSLMTQRHDSIL